MSKYDYEIEKYVVHYGKSEIEDVKKRAFDDEENAVKFAKEKLNEGFVVSIKQINHMVGWC